MAGLRKGKCRPEGVDEELLPRRVGTLGENFQPNPYGPPEGKGGGQPNVTTGEPARMARIAQRALVALRWMKPSQSLEVDPNTPVPDRAGYYGLVAWEAREAPCGDGVRRNAIVFKGQPEGYERFGSLGSEAQEVTVKSNYALNGAGDVVFSAACPTANTFADSTKVITTEILYARFRVRNPWLSRVVLKMGALRGNSADLKRQSGVKVWIARGQPIEDNRVTPIARVTSDQLVETQRTVALVFEALPLSIVDESVSVCPTPSDDDTYFLCVQTDEGITAEVTTRDDGAGVFWPFFELYTLVGSATGGAGPGGLPVAAVRSSAIIKLFAQKPRVPGATPTNIFTLPDASFAQAALLPSPMVGADAGDDGTASASPTVQTFHEVVQKPFILPRSWVKAKIQFTQTGGNDADRIFIELIKETAAGETVIASRDFTGLAIVAATSAFVIPVQIAGDVTFNIGDVFGMRVTVEHDDVGTLTLDHTRGSDETHLEAAISA